MQIREGIVESLHTSPQHLQHSFHAGLFDVLEAEEDHRPHPLLCHVPLPGLLYLAAFKKHAVSLGILQGKEIVKHAHGQRLAKATRPVDQSSRRMAVNQGLHQVCLIHIIILFPYPLEIIFPHGHHIMLLHACTTLS